jgi:hypothetical protein
MNTHTHTHIHTYTVNIQSELARVYNDISVQENHHCATCFAILRSEEGSLLVCADDGIETTTPFSACAVKCWKESS